MREEYLVDDKGKQTARIAQDVFICSSEQIQLARQFVGEFIWEMDDTFNTNELKMPLSIFVGLTNTSQTAHLRAVGYGHRLWRVEFDCPEVPKAELHARILTLYMQCL